jgi:hypothetical protein
VSFNPCGQACTPHNRLCVQQHSDDVDHACTRCTTTSDAWRLGNRNPRNVYLGETHVGMLIERELAAKVVETMNGDPDHDEKLRAEGRAQADNALEWHTTCVGCAQRLDDLYAERWAGAQDACRDLERALMAEYERTGDRSLLFPLGLVRAYASGATQSPVDASEPLPGGLGHSRFPGGGDGLPGYLRLPGAEDGITSDDPPE